MSEQVKTEERDRELQAIIDTVLIGNPQLKEALTFGSVLAIWQLPDASLGWTSTGEPMSPAIRRLAVIMHLRLEALPGFKHLLWLGNGFYPTAAFWKHRIGRAIQKGELISVSAPKFREFDEAEYRMFKIDPKEDYSTVAMQTMKLGEYEQEWVGYGVIGADELGKKDRNGNALPGFQTKKNRTRTVRTRAMLDMATLNYAIEGVTVSAEDILETQSLEIQDVSPTNVTPASAQIEAPKKEVVTLDADYQIQANRISALMEKVTAAGGMPGTILGLAQAFQSWAANANATELHDAADVLEEWLEENTTPPEPPPPPATKLPPEAIAEKGLVVDETGTLRTASGRKSRAKLGPDGQPLKPGRKPKTVSETTITETAESVTIVTSFPEADAKVKLPDGLIVGEHGVSVDVTDEVLREEFVFDDEATPPPEPEDPDYFADHADQVSDNVFETQDDTHDDAPYTGSEPQKNKIRVMADAAGLKDNGSKYALAAAMKGATMGALPKKIGAMMQNQPKPKEDTKAAQARLKAALDRVSGLGGAHMQITGTNTLNILDGGTAEAMNNAAAKLESWQPNREVVDLKRKEDATPAANPNVFPAVPADGPGAPSYKMLQSAFGQTQNPLVRVRIIDLAKRRLQGGDHNYLPAALRLAGKGDYKEIDSLIASREVR